jgi:hypothetical protein
MIHNLPEEIWFIIITHFLWDRLGLLRLIDTKFSTFIDEFFSHKHETNKNHKYIYYESESLAEWCIENKLKLNTDVSLSAIKHTKITREQLFPIDFKLLKHIIRNERIDIIQQLSEWIFHNKVEHIFFRIAFLETTSKNLQNLFFDIFKKSYTCFSTGKSDEQLIISLLGLLSEENLKIRLNPLAVAELLAKYPVSLNAVLKLFANYQFHAQPETQFIDFLLLPLSDIHLYTIIKNNFKSDPDFTIICQAKDSKRLKDYFSTFRKISHYRILLPLLSKSVTPLLLKSKWYEPFIKCRNPNLSEFKPSFNFKTKVPLPKGFLKDPTIMGANHDDVVKQLLINDDAKQMDNYLNYHLILFLKFDHYEYCTFQMFQHLKQQGYISCDFSNTAFAGFLSQYDQEWVDFLLYFFSLKDEPENYCFKSLFAHLTHFLKKPKDERNCVDIKIISEIMEFAKSQDKLNNALVYLENSIPIYRGFFDIIVKLPNFSLEEHCELFIPYDLETLKLLKTHESVGSNFYYLKNYVSNVVSFDALKYMKDNGFDFDDKNLFDVVKSLKKTDQLAKIVFLYEKQTVIYSNVNSFLTPDEVNYLHLLYSQN